MIDRLERLINLVIALRETRRPLTAEEIRRRVAGYGQDEYASFRRMFERDKSDLRGLGVPVDTVASDSGDDIEGYRIEGRAYDLPAVAFGDDELAALALAVTATGLGDPATRGLRKLEVARGGESSRTHTSAFELALDDPNRSTLSEAQLTRTKVRFTYQRADGESAARLIEPHGMIYRRGHWYVVGRDDDRDAMRSFRLDRIIDAVRTSGRAGAFEPPDESLDVDAVVPHSDDHDIVAVIAVTDELAWRVARRARGSGRELPDGRTAFEVLGHVEGITAWMIEDFPHVEAIGPPELRKHIHGHMVSTLDGRR